MRDMLGREDAVSVDAAKELINNHISFREPEQVALRIEEAYRRVLAEDIFSSEDLPHFSRSTVDGFALNSADTFGATEGLPAYINVAHEILMGEEPSFRLNKGEAAKIATGGMLPAGADSVLMLEHAQSVNESLIEALRPVAPKENVISAGEDAGKGELVLKKRSLLRPQDISALAAIGVTEVKVYKKPVVSIISTGDEVVPPHSAIAPGQIRDTNSYNLEGLILDSNCIPIRKGIFRDIYEDISAVVMESLETSDMVIITGGSSVGAKDMTSRIINSLGRPGVLFHGVALKPGKPTIGGVVNGIPVFGLPGHPAAVSVCFDIFVRPVLRSMSGLTGNRFSGMKTTLNARIAKNVSSVAGKEEHIRVALEYRDGGLWAAPVLGKSGLIRTLVKADGTVVIPVQSRGIEEGEAVEVILF
jgi:molybdopterin molybdotransferase